MVLLRRPRLPVQGQEVEQPAEAQENSAQRRGEVVLLRRLSFQDKAGWRGEDGGGGEERTAFSRI